MIVRGGFQGRSQGRGGMGLGRGRGQLIYYNYGGPGHYAWDCTNPTRISCTYCKQFDHELIDFPTLIAQICEKRPVPPTMTQNVQMMRFEPRDEDTNVNTVLRSGTTTGEEKGNLTKDDAGVGRETYLEARESFVEVFTRGSRYHPKPDRDPLMLTTFLETCIKLLHDNRVVKGLQELINICTWWSEPCVVRKL